MPVPNRYLTSLLVSYKGRKILIDCGEGTQVSMKIVGSGFKSIDAILITHFHADHIAGLPGILLTIANSGREEPIYIVGPPGLKNVVEGLLTIVGGLPYELRLIEGPNSDIEISDFKIKTLPLEHTVPCLAYSLYIRRRPKFDAEKAKERNIPIQLWGRLQNGESVILEGREYKPQMVLGEERKGIKLCYATDSRPVFSLASFAKDSDIFICEGMYGDIDALEKAVKNKHMLFSEAAFLAKGGKVDRLWLTHFSPSLLEPEKYIENAKNIFENTEIGEDRKVISLKFK
jgi:ribonuclease Z